LNIVRAYPPNYTAIVTSIPGARNPNVVYTYGDTVYTGNSPAQLPADLAEHEAVHAEQQAVMSVEAWWSCYLADKQFRLEQELAAYRVQYKYVQSFASRTQRRTVLSHIISALASPIYGNVVNREQARELITQ
jgi:hypothetical protein